MSARKNTVRVPDLAFVQTISEVGGERPYSSDHYAEREYGQEPTGLHLGISLYTDEDRDQGPIRHYELWSMS